MERRFTPQELESILRRASDLDSDQDGFTASQTVSIGQEIGIPATAVELAVAEHDRSPRGMGGRAHCVVVTPLPPDVAGERIRRFMIRRRLSQNVRGIWEQRDGSWPDQDAETSVTRLGIRTVPSASGATVTVDVDASELWFGAVAVVALALLVVGSLVAAATNPWLRVVFVLSFSTWVVWLMNRLVQRLRTTTERVGRAIAGLLSE